MNTEDRKERTKNKKLFDVTSNMIKANLSIVRKDYLNSDDTILMR